MAYSTVAAVKSILLIESVDVSVALKSPCIFVSHVNVSLDDSVHKDYQLVLPAVIMYFCLPAKFK